MCVLANLSISCRSQETAKSYNVVSLRLYCESRRRRGERHADGRRRGRRRHLPGLRERMHLSQQRGPVQCRQKLGPYTHLYLYFHQLFSSQEPSAADSAAAQDQAHGAPEPQVPQEPCCRQSTVGHTPYSSRHKSYRTGLYSRSHAPTSCSEPTRFIRSEAPRPPTQSCRRRSRGCQSCPNISSSSPQQQRYSPARAKKYPRYQLQVRCSQSEESVFFHFEKSDFHKDGKASWETISPCFHDFTCLLKRRRGALSYFHVRRLFLVPHKFLRII